MNSVLHCKASGGGRVRLLAGLVMAGMLSVSGFAQTTATLSQTSGPLDILAQYQQGQWTLGQQWEALVSEGVTIEQLEAWRQ